MHDFGALDHWFRMPHHFGKVRCWARKRRNVTSTTTLGLLIQGNNSMCHRNAVLPGAGIMKWNLLA